MQYVLFFLLIIVLLILLDKWLNRNAKRDFINSINEEWGTRNTEHISDEEFSKIRYYFDNTKGEYDIDDITWHDLDMDRIYSIMNRTNCYIGREYLYAMLRKQDFDVESLQEKDSIIKLFEKDKDARTKLQLALRNIGNKSDISIYEYLTRIGKLESNNCFISKIQDIILLVAIFLIIINNKFGLVLGVVMIAVNIVTYFQHKSRIAPYLSFFSYLIRMSRSVEDICKIKSKELSKEINRLSEISNHLGKLRKKSYLLAQSNISGSFFEGMMDYVKMVSHVDIIKFYSMLEAIKANDKYIKEMYEIVGKLDSLCAVASFRETLDYYCEPEFLDNSKLEYSCQEVYHPLIVNPVSNSIDVDKSVLLTGSNASGKSTFIRTLALNALLSQTIYTSISKKYVAPFYQIYSSMALTDNLLGGESYYMVEIKSLKRVLVADTTKYPVLCFIDEVLRGTNTLERIAASSHILNEIVHNNTMCIAATHDIELTKILEREYECYHFREQVLENDIKFDYKLYKGPAKSRNAIKLLKIIGYDDKIVNEASSMAGRFLETGKWDTI